MKSTQINANLFFVQGDSPKTDSHPRAGQPRKKKRTQTTIFPCRRPLPQAHPKKRRRKIRTMTFPCRRALLLGAHRPYHHILPFRYRHLRLVSLQTWQESRHRLQVSRTYPSSHRFRDSLHRRRHHHQAFLEARPPVTSPRRLLAFPLHLLVSDRLQEGSLLHPWGYSTICPLLPRASSRDAGPRPSHKARDLELPCTLRHLYLTPHPLL